MLRGTPSWLVKLATTRTCRPTWSWVGVKVAPVAPAMLTNVLPLPLCHWYVTALAGTPLKARIEPGEADSAWPSVGVRSAMAGAPVRLSSWSANCSCSIWRTVSVPSKAVPRRCATVQVPSALRVTS